ncbi:MAG: TolC family protein [Hydrotalea sp.]|nr:TolC family protein [Hydrotalea sp.]
MMKKIPLAHRRRDNHRGWRNHCLTAVALSWFVTLPTFLLPSHSHAQGNAAVDSSNQATSQPTSQGFGLRDAFVAAYNYDPRIKAALESVKASEASLNTTRAARLPQVSFSTSYGPLEAKVNGASQSYGGQQVNNSLSISAPIATFGRQESSEKLAASQLMSAKIDFEQKKTILFDDVAQSYFGLLFSEQVYRLKSENKSLLEKQLAEAKTRFDREAMTITELRAVRTRLNNANIELLNASANYIAQKQKLASLIGRTDIAGLTVDSGNEFLKKLPATLDDAKNLLLANAPALKESGQAIIRAQAGVDSSRAGFFPQLTLQGGTSSSLANNDMTQQQYATLNMSMVLASGGTSLLDQTRVMAELKRAQYNLADTKNILIQDLQNRWQNYQSYNQIVKDRYNNLQQYEKIYQNASRSLALGQNTLSQVIDVRSRLIEQYIDYANAVNTKMIFGVGLANSLGLIN